MNIAEPFAQCRDNAPIPNIVPMPRHSAESMRTHIGAYSTEFTQLFCRPQRLFFSLGLMPGASAACFQLQYDLVNIIAHVRATVFAGRRFRACFELGLVRNPSAGVDSSFDLVIFAAMPLPLVVSVFADQRLGLVS